MPISVFIIILLGLLLFAGIGYLVVLTFPRVRLKADVLKLLTFEVDAERDTGPTDPEDKPP